MSHIAEVEKSSESSAEADQPPLSLTRLPWVDVLRGVAVLLVLFRHMHLARPKATAGFLYRGLYTLQTGGNVGVDLFFVISGFLVSGILFRQYVQTGRVRPLQFLIRRGFKIYPPFWTFIGVSLIWVWFSEHKLPLRNALVELAFIQNYFSGLYAHTWSLGVEEHCYVGLCLLLTCLALSTRKRGNPFGIFPVIAVVLGLAALVMRSQDFSQITRDTFLKRVTPTHLRCDAFLAGALMGYYYYFSNGAFLRVCQRYRGVLFAIGSACILPVFFVDLEATSGYSTWLFWCCTPAGTLLLMSALGTDISMGWKSRLIAMIGRHSYSIYLWHILVGVRWLDLVYARLGIPSSIVTWVPVYFLVSITTGMLLTHLIEIPSLRLRDRWFPESAKVAATPPVEEMKETEALTGPHFDYAVQFVNFENQTQK